MSALKYTVIHHNIHDNKYVMNSKENQFRKCKWNQVFEYTMVCPTHGAQQKQVH